MKRSLGTWLLCGVLAAGAFPARAQDAPPAAPAEDPAAALEAAARAAEGDARAPAFIALAKKLEELARWFDAAAAWREAGAATPTAQTAAGEGRALLAFAEELLVAQEPGSSVRAAFDDARSAFRRARELGSKDVAVPIGLARCLAAEGLAAEQIRELERATAEFPDDPSPRRALAFALYHAGKAAEAIPVFRKLSDAAPADAALSLTLADCARSAGDEPLAIEMAERTIREHPSDSSGWDALWKVYAPGRRWGELADRLVRAANLDPQGAIAQHYAGFAAENARRWDVAVAHLERAWKLNPADAAAKIRAARILVREKHDRNAAAAACREVMATIPGQREAVDVLSFICYLRSNDNDHAGAIADLEVLVKYSPEDPVLVANLALEQRWAGRNADAEASYRRAIELSPRDPVLRNDLGLLYLVQGRDAEARTTFLAGVETDPEFNDNMENLGWMARRDGDLAGALHWYGRALAAAVRKGGDTSRHRRNTDEVRFPLPALAARR